MQPVKSLKKSCLLYIGEHAQCYDAMSFRELPMTLLDQLQKYLSAYELHRLHSLYLELGVSTGATWWKLLRKRWPERHHRVAHIFHGDDVILDPHQRYFEKHFRELLQQLQFNGYLDTHWQLNLSLHKIQMSSLVDQRMYENELCGYEQRTNLASSFSQYLLYYARWVRRLSILGIQCHHLLQQTQLLHALKDAVEAIDLHLVQDRMYPYIRRLVGFLLKEGRLKSLMLYNTRLSDANMKELLSLCSGRCEYQECRPSTSSRLDVNSVEPSTLKSLLAVDLAKNSYVSLDGAGCSWTSASEDEGIKGSDAGDQICNNFAEESSLTGMYSSVRYSPVSFNDAEGGVSLSPAEYNSSSGENEHSNADEEDLYDTALMSGATAKATNSHKSNTGSQQPIPIIMTRKRSHEKSNDNEDAECKRGKNYWTNQEPDDNVLDSQPTVSIVGDHSRFIEDFCNTDLATSYEIAHSGGQVIPSDPSKPNKGLESFAIMFTGLCELDELIQEVLPDWSGLRKLAISHTMLLNQGLQSYLMSLLLNGQLEELVIEDTKMPPNLMDFIAMVLIGKQEGVPSLRALTLTNVVHPLCPMNFTVPSDFPTKSFSGVVHLDLSNNKFENAGTDLLCQLLKKDDSLQSLKLESCGLSVVAVSQIVTALQESRSLTSLNLSENITVGEVMKDIISFLRSPCKLKVLTLNNCDLRRADVGGENFLQTIVSHPTLEELSLSWNSLCDAAIGILLKLGEGWTSSQKPRLTHLDIGYNHIGGDALVQCGLKIARDLEGSGVVRPLNRLVLTGNKVLQQHRPRLNVFFKVAHQLEANMVEEAAVPLAEHVAQM